MKPSEEKQMKAKPKRLIIYRFGMSEGIAFVECKPTQTWKITKVDDKVHLHKQSITLRIPKEAFEKDWVALDGD